MFRSTNWLKIHLFLFFSGISCLVVFTATFVKTYTDATYDEIGFLLMLSALLGGLLKTVVCTAADRQGSYKQCLMWSLGAMVVSSLLPVLIPFQPQLFFDEPHPRFIWYLTVLDCLVFFSSSQVIITLGDVFIIHSCVNSMSGEYFGQYRFIGVLGWGFSSVCLAIVEPYIQLPYLALPMAFVTLFMSLDLIAFSRVPNLKTLDPPSSRSVAGSSVISMDKTPMPCPTITREGPIGSLSFFCEKDGRHSRKSSRSLTDEPVKIIRSYVSSLSLNKLGLDENFSWFSSDNPTASVATRGSKDQVRIGFSVQLDLLIRLNLYDRFNLFKYLIIFVFIGAFMQIHWVFYIQYMSALLEQRLLLGMLFSFSACVQVFDGLGETLGLLWLARFVIRILGRDAALMLCIVISGVRYLVNAFFIHNINIWLIASFEIFSGTVFGICYTLMTEIGAAYLSLLDGLLLLENEPSSNEEARFVSYLEDLKEIYSIETIRSAIRATLQSLFSGACEGVGFAVGPMLAGLWLHACGDSFENLYRSLTYLHGLVLLGLMLLELGLVRFLLGTSSRVNKLEICSRERHHL